MSMMPVLGGGHPSGGLPSWAGLQGSMNRKAHMTGNGPDMQNSDDEKGLEHQGVQGGQSIWTHPSADMAFSAGAGSAAEAGSVGIGDLGALLA